jgi:hypothetical protein
MQGTRDRLIGTASRSDIATANSPEHRAPRFAELDAKIKAARTTRQRSPGNRSKRHRDGPRLPAAVRKEITRCAQQLRQHRLLFISDPKLKDRAARFLRSLLPPRRKRWRPGIDSVTKAIRLLNLLRRQHAAEKPELIWKRIYPEAIPGYEGMDRERQKAERLLLRERVHSRRHRQRNHRLKLQ